MNNLIFETPVVGKDSDQNEDVTLKFVKIREKNDVNFFILNRMETKLGVAKAIFKDHDQSVYIKMMKNLAPIDCKGIGTSLDKMIMEERGEKGYKGSVKLLAIGNAHLFHWKMGFRVDQKENRKVIKIKNSQFRSIRTDFKKIKSFKKLLEEYKENEMLTELVNLIDKKSQELSITKRTILKDPFKYFPEFSNTKSGFIKWTLDNENGKERGKTDFLGPVNMFMPERSLRIWNKIIENQDSAKCPKLFAKLRKVPQPE